MADTVTGTWKGHLDIKMPPQAASANAQQQEMMKKMMDSFKKMVFVLSLKGNKTYSLTVQGLPAGTPNAGDTTQTGKWTQKGNSVTMTPNPKKDKPAEPAVTLTLAGKTLTLIPPGSAGQGKIVFTKS